MSQLAHLTLIRGLLLDGVDSAAIARVIDTLIADLDTPTASSPVAKAPIATDESPEAMIASVAKRHRVSPAAITGRSRGRSLVKARYDAIRSVREAFPELSSTDLGRVFKRDHTSILHALKAGGEA